MSNLIDFVIDTSTDINTLHSYVPTLEQLFAPIRDKQLNILILGVEHGGTLIMCDSYFPNCTIHAVDPSPPDRFRYHTFHQDNVTLYSSTDATDVNFVDSAFLHNNIKFDIILDDTNPRNNITQSNIIRLYTQLLNPEGMLIIQDVQAMHEADYLLSIVPEELQSKVEIVDLRPVKERYDDILFIVHN
jgi:spermidine synthase